MDWQQVASLLVVFVALVYLVRRGWQVVRGRRQSGCSSCPSCGPSTKQLVTLATTHDKSSWRN